MLVQCPSCKTTYRVADDVIKGTTPAFRCSRCKHTFELEPQDSPEESAETTPSAKTVEEQELSFTFPPKEKEGGSGQEQDGKEFVGSPAQDHGILAANIESADQWSMSAGEPKHEEPFTISEARDRVKVDKAIGPPKEPQPEEPVFQSTPPPRDATDNLLPLDPYRDQRASTVPYLTLFGLLIIFMASVTAFHLAHPKASEGLVRQIPWVGALVLRNNHLKNGVALQSLRVSYQTIQGNREVFVLTGVVANHNPVVVREVRVAGQLYNREGKTIEQQTIWIGNAISPKIIRGMTSQDISDLQRLKPLKSFEIPPGDSVPFAIVFLKPSKEIKDFTCDVLSAEGEG